jgi:hypothetical protein
MLKQWVVCGLACAAMVSVTSAQTKKPASAKTVKYDLTAKADQVYTGTMEISVEGGKVTGSMLVTSPTEITGTVSGSEKKGVLNLSFPYHMTENKCQGQVTMNITLPAKPGPATGTMEAQGCSDPSEKVTGTVELVPSAGAKKTR